MTVTVFILIGAVLAFLLYIKLHKPAPQKNPGKEALLRSDPPPETDFEAIVDSLLRLNILMRKDRDLSEQMVAEIEAVIDDLMVITPVMMERYPGEALTYEIKKIGQNHLYKIVKEYLDLSGESREAQFDMFQKTIQSLREVSNRSRQIVEKNETAEFKTMANFLAGKFS